jgi:hypothetical protein
VILFLSIDNHFFHEKELVLVFVEHNGSGKVILEKGIQESTSLIYVDLKLVSWKYQETLTFTKEISNFFSAKDSFCGY